MVCVTLKSCEAATEYERDREVRVAEVGGVAASGLGLHSAALFGETNTANANAPYGGMCTGPPTALQNNAGCNFTTAVYSGALPQFLETLSTPPDGFEAYQCTLYKVWGCGLDEQNAVLIHSVTHKCTDGCSCSLDSKTSIPMHCEFRGFANQTSSMSTQTQQIEVKQAAYKVYLVDRHQEGQLLVQQANCQIRKANSSINSTINSSLFAKNVERMPSPADHESMLNTPQEKAYFQTLVEAELNTFKFPTSVPSNIRMFGPHATTTCGGEWCTRNGFQIGTTNCCPWACGSTSENGGYPFMWENEAVTMPENQRGSNDDSDTMCTEPGVDGEPPLATHEILLRFRPCMVSGAPPLCIRIKVS